MHIPTHVNENGLPGLDIPNQSEAQSVDRNALASKAVVELLAADHFPGSVGHCRTPVNAVNARGRRWKPLRSPVKRRVLPLRLAASKDARPNSVGVAEPNQPNPVDQIKARISTLALPKNAANSLKHIALKPLATLVGVVVVAQGLPLAQLLGEAVQQKLAVAVSVDVAHAVLDDYLPQLIGVGQISIVDHTDPKRVIRVERLGLGAGRRPSRRVANVA